MIVPAIELQSFEQGAVRLNEIPYALKSLTAVHV